MIPRELYKFGPFILDTKAKVLLRDEIAVNLTRKGVETLAVLVENAGQVVTKEELLNKIWPDRVVDEANLTQNIATVRKALAAEPGNPAHIETFPGRGYRLTGPVEIQSYPLKTTDQIEKESVRTNGLVDEQSNSLSEPRLRFLKLAPEQPASLLKPKSNKKLWLVASAFLVMAIIGLWWLFGTASTRTVSSNYSVMPVTRLAGEERQPTLSPDGNKLAFLWQQGEGKSPALCVLESGQNSHQVIGAVEAPNGEGIYHSPAWSPDGRALAYLRTVKSGTEVCIRNLADGRERIVTTFPSPNYGSTRRMLDWSPDGFWIVISHSVNPAKPNGLTLVNVATGEQRMLTAPELLVGGDTDPQFAPNSQQIIYIRNFARSHQELFVYDLRENKERQLTQETKQISSVSWSQNGREILFASNRRGENRIWRAPLSEIAEPKAENVYSESPIEFTIARRADVLVYGVQPQNRNIWQYDLLQKNWTRLIASSAQDASPQYSADGSAICFRSDRQGHDNLFVSDNKGNKQEAIANEPLFPSVGHWSPDGKSIAFNNSQNKQLYLAKQVNDRWEIQPLPATGVHPVFSNDGQQIFAGTTEKLLRISLQDMKVSSLLETGGFSLGLGLDGQWLYFMRAANDTALWQVNTQTGELKKTLDGIIPQCTSCWALAKRGIYYLGSDASSFDQQAIYFLDFATGKTREIIKYPEPLVPVGSGPFSLSPDERYLLLVRVDAAESDIMRVAPFR